jgi:hypothetical protein
MEYAPISLADWYADGLRWIASLFTHGERIDTAPDTAHPDEIVAETRHRLSRYC